MILWQRNSAVLSVITFWIFLREFAPLEVCGGENRNVRMSRSLFETLLNLTFLVRRRVPLNRFNDSSIKLKLQCRFAANS